MTSILLGKFFGISARFWLNMQNHNDLLEAQRANPERIAQATYYADLQAAQTKRIDEKNRRKERVTIVARSYS